MKRLGLSVLGLLLLLVSPALALQVPSTHLVSPQWLASHMNNPHLVIVDVRSPKAYRAGHIPHAVNIPLFFKFFAGQVDHIKFMLNTYKQITKEFRKAGISNDSIVIFYGSNARSAGYSDATRAFWTAWVYGLSNIAILHGGIEKWKSENRPTTKQTYTPTPGNFTIKTMRLSAIATWPDIYYAVATHKIQLVDSRPPVFYTGKLKGPIIAGYPLIKGNGGHIAGAVDVFAGALTKKAGNHYELMGPSEIKNVFENKGIDLSKPVISYGFIGYWGTAPWFAAKFLAGAKEVKVYDGSMAEYSRMPLPVVKGKNPLPQKPMIKKPQPSPPQNPMPAPPSGGEEEGC